MKKQMSEIRPMIDNVENYKRRRALPNFGFDTHFFDRVMAMKKLQELVFIPKSAAKNR